MLPQEIIRKKRDGARLSVVEINDFVAGLVDGRFTDAQVSALAMAIFLKGMNSEETVALTRAMTGSGSVLTWEDLDLNGPVLDKHSTGGVGDRVSLKLAPIIAAAGGYVPMISGRGLGHSGGTLDKLESIPGYNATPDIDLFRQTVRQVGCAVIGQTPDLAPADRRLYAVRDVTATVESIPLITASILSKKIAAGLDGLVMDVKTGSGAFAQDITMARDLARSIVTVATGAGLPTEALITDMNQVLGRSVGNALEVREAVDYLVGEHRDPRAHAVTQALAAAMLHQCGLASDEADGRAKAEAVLDSGAAAEVFGRMVAALGGPSDFIAYSQDHLPEAPLIRPALPAGPGILQAMDTRAYGLAVVALGGGRKDPAAEINPAVGLSEVAGLGEAVGPDKPLAMIHAACEVDAERAARQLRDAVTLGEDAPTPGPVVIETVTAGQGTP